MAFAVMGSINFDIMMFLQNDQALFENFYIYLFIHPRQKDQMASDTAGKSRHTMTYRETESEKQTKEMKDIHLKQN